MALALDSAELSPGAREQANGFADVITSVPGAGILTIEGHTDAIGSREDNIDSSRRRQADAVMGYLVAKGFPAPRDRRWF